MKATDLRENNVISITFGAMIAEQLVLIVGIDRNRNGELVAVGIDMDNGSTVEVNKPSDYRSGNGSPIGSWHKLSDKHAEQTINEFITT